MTDLPLELSFVAFCSRVLSRMVEDKIVGTVGMGSWMATALREGEGTVWTEMESRKGEDSKEFGLKAV